MKKTLLISILLLISFSIFSVEEIKAQTVNQINKEELKGKVWIPLKGNEEKAESQKFNEDGSIVIGGFIKKGTWEWKDDKTLFIEYLGRSWEEKVIKLSEKEFVMVCEGATYHFTIK